MPELNRPTDAARDPVADDAATWLLRLRDAPDDPRLKAELDAWLSRDRRHAEAWRAAQRVWSLAGAVGPAPRRRAGRTPARMPARMPARVWGFALAAAVSVCVAIILLPPVQLQMRADYASAVGETRTVELADGSRVQLDSASAIAVDYTPGRRAVTLLAGQAFFSVRQDRGRPFSVAAEEVDVTVTGTEFDVRLASADVAVAVAEGEVRVSYSPNRRQEAQTDGTVLAAGQRLRVRRQDGAGTLAPVPPQSVAPWRRGRLLIESATIGELVDELRRYRPGAIVITDKALAGQRVTGVFDLSDPVRALRTVVEPHAGRVREVGPWLVVVSGG